MNKQEIFDTVSVHLLRQGKKSMKTLPKVGEACAYRGDGGCMCAIGALIPDDKYDPDMENQTVYGLIDEFPGALAHLGIFAGLGASARWHASFLAKLQAIHDSTFLPADWPRELAAFAAGEGLNTSAMDAFIAEQKAGNSSPVAA